MRRAVRRARESPRPRGSAALRRAAALLLLLVGLAGAHRVQRGAAVRDRHAQRRRVLPAAPAQDGRLSRPRGSGALRRAAALLLLLVGVALLAEGAVTLAWREPLGAISAGREQNKLSKQLREAEAQALAAPTGFVARERDDRQAALVRRYKGRAETGDPLGRIELPSLDEQFVFVSGVSGAELKKGPGHYPTTALPGEHGTVGIAGHRTTYLAPFRDIDDLERGDRIVVRMPYGVFRYAVEGRTLVSPQNTRSLRRVKHDRLALTTCHPPFSAAQRMVVTASLRSSTLR